MEWLLIFNLSITGVSNPPPVAYSSQYECAEVAKKIADENKWLHYLKVGPGTLRAEPGVYRPTVSCEPAEWSRSPKGSK